MGDAAAGDAGHDAACLKGAAVDIEVVAAVGVEVVRAPTGPTADTTDGGEGVDQRQQLGHVVAVPASQRQNQRYSTAIGQEVVLGSLAGAVYR